LGCRAANNHGQRAHDRQRSNVELSKNLHVAPHGVPDDPVSPSAINQQSVNPPSARWVKIATTSRQVAWGTAIDQLCRARTTSNAIPNRLLRSIKNFSK
jgi:hypothetical protein